MTTREINKQVKAIRETAAEVRTSPMKAKELLYKTGMYTKSGTLKPQFR